MVDIETQVYNYVNEALTSHFASKGNKEFTFLTTYIPRLSTYPTIILTQISNTPYRKGEDNIRVENFTKCSFQFDIFVNGIGEKQEANEIRDIIDSVLSSYKFIREDYKVLDNYVDPSVYRLVLRYSAIVGRDYRIYTS